MQLIQRFKHAYWKFPGLYRAARRNCHEAYLRTNAGYRAWLTTQLAANGPFGLPKARWHNAALKKISEWQGAVEQARKLGLPLHEDLPKNWDSLAALDLILSTTNTKARILDAGSMLYSVLLPWLFIYGYRNLVGINLLFKSKIRRGSIVYEYGDITQTHFRSSTFDVITCLSVVEHGVELNSYFREMSRILKPGGLLFTSTDYYESPIETKGQLAFGVPIHIFDRKEIVAAIDVAKHYHLVLTGIPDLDCEETPIHWKDFDLRYTFLTLTLRKLGGDAAGYEG